MKTNKVHNNGVPVASPPLSTVPQCERSSESLESELAKVHGNGVAVILRLRPSGNADAIFAQTAVALRRGELRGPIEGTAVKGYILSLIRQHPYTPIEAIAPDPSSTGGIRSSPVAHSKDECKRLVGRWAPRETVSNVWRALSGAPLRLLPPYYRDQPVRAQVLDTGTSKRRP